MKRTEVHTLIIGSGAAGLNAALQLKRQGIDDILILSEGLQKGTSINTGSDKQTYYKLSLCGSDGDSPLLMADVYYKGGAMHGDLALVEASVSPKAFFNLVNIGVPFPTDPYGQFAGYKTDHDPAQRATSIGPYTSREMCRALIKEVKKAAIAIREKRDVIELITITQGDTKRAAGAIAIGEDDQLEIYRAENVIFAVGGPGGLYETSVYPGCHTGAIGLALQEGALADNLPESQFGLASTKFRWNVSGTYMQVIPRFVSVDPENEKDEREFLRDYFSDPGEMNSKVFLKGYQWPFDAAKVLSGSSIIDILVFIETVEKGRKVYLDFRRNPEDFSLESLSTEAQDYLTKSAACLPSPIKRLEKMNPGAINLYLDHNIDIRKEKLEIAVCAQHNNGGLAADLWWQSENISHLFPVGEVNGSHGVDRPGGSALNSGQVGGFRAAEYIANVYRDSSLDKALFAREVERRTRNIANLLEKGKKAKGNWQEERKLFQRRMSRCGAFIRRAIDLKNATAEAKAQMLLLEKKPTAMTSGREIREYFRNRHLCFAHYTYLQAILYALESGVGSRGSAMILADEGEPVKGLSSKWILAPENRDFHAKIQLSLVENREEPENSWIERRKIPEQKLWFETIWQQYRDKEIYR
jgi:succinate dehydrogenase/fumarate reductase flavoprotein subunit